MKKKSRNNSTVEMGIHSNMQEHTVSILNNIKEEGTST